MKPGGLQLARVLGLRDLVLFNIAAVIGIRWLATAAHSGPGSLTLWLLAAMLFFVPSALVVSRLAAAAPEEGGLYVWTRVAFGEKHGFLCGWCYWLSNLFYAPNLIVAGVAMAAEALGLAENKAWVLAVSLAILWVASLGNLVGLAAGKWVSNAGAVATYAAGALIIGAGMLVCIRSVPATPIRPFPHWDLDRLNFWSQIAFAFGGLELGAVLGGEIRDPARTVPRAAWISGLAIALFYVLGTLAILVLVPEERVSILTGLVQAGEAAETRLGKPALGTALIWLVLAGVAGQLGAWIGGSARVPLAMGLDRHLPALFATLHPRWKTPHLTILGQAAVCTAALLVMQAGETLRISYQLLVDLTVITYFIPFLYMFAAGWKAGARLASASGMAVTALGIMLSALPPAETASLAVFEVKVIGGTLLLVAVGLLCYRGRGVNRLGSNGTRRR